jgi:hypothetical protein
VTVDGALTACGAPQDNLGGDTSGVVRVYNSVSGALLYVIQDPAPFPGSRFGSSLALTGEKFTREVFQPMLRLGHAHESARLDPQVWIQ